MSGTTTQARHGEGRGETGTGGASETLSTARLVARALDQVRDLMRRELDLARAEADRSLRHAGAAIGLIGGALVLALGAVDVLSAALVAVITQETALPAWLSAAIVGGALAVVALALALAARSALSRVQFGPERVAGNVRKDVQTVRERTRDHD
ncbi:phage holin family protein [Rhodovulum sp. 12E13]|uniref:phage holin family protein n=1 Tax=Rhodovulum sp. 12E13 TaxID=2203891 RepID=UPI000E18AF7E|nr:phage holin family protein [Rhodovulum sp. 12E13]RDC69920.1 phage holin family protein [Rhodovulum sp. 12E13]